MQPTHSTDWSKPGDFYGMTQYRIEFTRTDHGLYQRHVWRNDEGETEIQDWIPSLPSLPSNAIAI